MEEQPRKPTPVFFQTNPVIAPSKFNLDDTSEKTDTVYEWSEQEEFLLALWSDRSLCYKLMTERASRKFHKEHLYFSIPVIILSTLCGSANLAVQSYVPVVYQSLASMAIGITNLCVGVITTLSNFMRSSEKCESHRNSSTSWGKLHRLIYTELSLERNKRKPVKDFMRQAKNEYDRILDQSPVIPGSIMRPFVEDIKRHPKLLLPEECGNLLHTASWERVREQRIAFLSAQDEIQMVEVMNETP